MDRVICYDDEGIFLHLAGLLLFEDHAEELNLLLTKHVAHFYLV